MRLIKIFCLMLTIFVLTAAGKQTRSDSTVAQLNPQKNDGDVKFVVGTVRDVIVPVTGSGQQLKAPFVRNYVIQIDAELEWHDDNAVITITEEVGRQGSGVAVEIPQVDPGTVILVAAIPTQQTGVFDNAGEYQLPIGIKTPITLSQGKSKEIVAALNEFERYRRDELTEGQLKNWLDSTNDYIWSLGATHIVLNEDSAVRKKLCMTFGKPDSSKLRVLWLDQLLGLKPDGKAIDSVEQRHRYLRQWIEAHTIP